MADGQNDVVEEALNDCAAEFKRGVDSFYGPSRPSELRIDDGVIDELKNVLRPTFAEHLDPGNPAQRRDWEKDKERILPMAFYTGALAACYAHNALVDEKLVTTARARRALEYVSAYCQGPAPEASDTRGKDFRPEWIYCPPWSAAGGESQG